MRKYIYIIILINIILLISCSSVKNNTNQEKIIYVIPDTVQIWFNNVIEKSNSLSQKENIYFIIGQTERNNKRLYNIKLCDANKLDFKDDFFVKNTNRYVYIKGDLFPLLNDVDQIFSTRDYNNKELLDLLKNNHKIKQLYKIYESGVFWVIFDNKWGDIIETSDDSKGGYKTNSPNIKN